MHHLLSIEVRSVAEAGMMIPQRKFWHLVWTFPPCLLVLIKLKSKFLTFWPFKLWQLLLRT